MKREVHLSIVRFEPISRAGRVALAEEADRIAITLADRYA